MTNRLTKGLMTTALISTTLLSNSKLHAAKPALFNNLPQDTLLIAHSENLNKSLEMYEKTQLWKELSAIDYYKVLKQSKIFTADEAEIKAVFSKENIDKLTAILDSSLSFAVLKPNLEGLNTADEDFADKLMMKVAAGSILQLKPAKAGAINDLIKQVSPLLKDNYSRTESSGYVVNQFKIDKENSAYILEKAGVFTFTKDPKKTISLLKKGLNKNMNNLESAAPIYANSHDSIAYVNVREAYDMIKGLQGSTEISTLLKSINYFTDYLVFGDTDVKGQSERSTLITKFNKNIPSYIKTLVKNNKSTSKTSSFFNKDTALYYNFNGLNFNEIVDYALAQNDVSLKDLIEADPEMDRIYNKLTLGLGNEYSLNISGVKAGMIPMPLATMAIEVKSEKVIKEIIADELSEPLKSGSTIKLTKMVKGTEITTLTSPMPGLMPGYMFYKGYLFISTDQSELVKVLNTTDSSSLQASADFKKATASEKALYQTSYINGEKLFGNIEQVVTGLTPLIAQTPSEQVLYTHLVIPFIKALKNLKILASTAQATSEMEFKTTNKVYVK